MKKALIVAAAVSFVLSAPAEARRHHHHHRHHSHHHHRTYDASGNVTFLPHPAGCPRIAFCGCGARKHLGLSDPRLNLVANWPSLYHGSAKVAMFGRHHIAVIDRMTGPHTAMVYDYNSGRHLSRYHERDLRGARILGGGFASLESTGQY